MGLECPEAENVELIKGGEKLMGKQVETDDEEKRSDEVAQRVATRILTGPKRFPKAEGLAVYEPLPTDVIVTTYPKSGTTLTQQLAYQIVVAAGGASPSDPSGMDFDDICRVVPIVEFGPAHGFAPFDTTPRLFKSHFPANLFTTKVQRHLVVIRDPAAFTASYLDFVFDVWAGEPVPDTRTREKIFHIFCRERVLRASERYMGFPYEKEIDLNSVNSKRDSSTHLPVPAWFLHAGSWLQALRNGVYIMFYEDIIADMHAAVLDIARFIGVQVSEQGIKQVIERCDREYMAKDDKFMCHLEAVCFNFGDSRKAKSNSRDGFKQFKLDDEEREWLRKLFRQQFGVDSYSEFRQLVKDKQAEFLDDNQ